MVSITRSMITASVLSQPKRITSSFIRPVTRIPDLWQKQSPRIHQQNPLSFTLSFTPFVFPRQTQLQQRLFSQEDDNNSNNNKFETSNIEEEQVSLSSWPVNLYQEWSLEDDTLLWSHRNEPLPRLASMLGRGLRGIKARLEKLSNVDSPAYQRLFSSSNPSLDNNNNNNENNEEELKLTPAREVLRRIQWDQTLDPSSFSILHYDRVEETLISSPFNAPNDSISGKETQLAFALPEHRIVAIQYKEQTVWDRASRLDLVFGSARGSGRTIDMVLENYDDWKKQNEEQMEWNRRRQLAVSDMVRTVLKTDLRFQLLKQMSSTLQEQYDSASAAATSYGNAGSSSLLFMAEEIDDYVKNAMDLFRLARQEQNDDDADHDKPIRSDIDDLYLLAELVALIPQQQIDDSNPNIITFKERILSVIDNAIEGRKPRNPGHATVNTGQLPPLNEDELTEKFVRGSGAGGQKINKTSNRVVLLHKPTQIRVECQDTRSLQQNRKIARKRLQEKLDEYFNGDQSRVGIKAAKAVNKKMKAKARSKARRRKKQASATEQTGNLDE